MCEKLEVKFEMKTAIIGRDEHDQREAWISNRIVHHGDEGMVYETQGDKGQTYIKSRPEYIELQRLRDKKRAYIKAIGISSAEAEDPDFA